MKHQLTVARQDTDPSWGWRWSLQFSSPKSCFKQALLEKVVQDLSNRGFTNFCGIESTVCLGFCFVLPEPSSWFKQQTNKKKIYNILYTHLEFPPSTSSHKHSLIEVRHWEVKWKELILSRFRSDVCLNSLFSFKSLFKENFPLVILRSSFYCLIKMAFPWLRARLNSKSCPTPEAVPRKNSGLNN